MRLSGGGYSVALAPEGGGALAGAWFEREGTQIPILRPGAPGIGDPTGAGCFPLAPFCNRLRDGRFSFRGRTIEVPRNRVGERHPLHGQAWLATWSAERLGPDRAEMRFQHGRGEWPWRYEAIQSIATSDDGVGISLVLRNLDDQAMPAGLGLHPYFPAGMGVRLRTLVSSAMLTDDENMPTGRPCPAQGAYDLSDRLISGAGLDNGFSDWSGELEILYPDHALRMTASSNAAWLQVYAPRGEAFFCAEPVTHANDALAADEAGWAKLGIKVLEPGQTLRLDIQLEVLWS